MTRRRIAVALMVEIPDEVDPLDLTVLSLSLALDGGRMTYTARPLGVGAYLHAFPPAMRIAQVEIHPDPDAIFAP